MDKVQEKLSGYLPSNPEALRQDALILFNKLIRTKNPASLQEDPIHGGGTLGDRSGKERAPLQVSFSKPLKKVYFSFQCVSKSVGKKSFFLFLLGLTLFIAAEATAAVVYALYMFGFHVKLLQRMRMVTIIEWPKKFFFHFFFFLVRLISS